MYDPRSFLPRVPQKAPSVKTGMNGRIFLEGRRPEDAGVNPWYRVCADLFWSNNFS